MSVGQAITERTGLRLFHNHLSIELALRYFDYGTRAFVRLNEEIRCRVIDEVAASDLPGLVFTFVWAFDVPGDQAFVDEYARPAQVQSRAAPWSSSRCRLTIIFCRAGLTGPAVRATRSRSLTPGM